MRELSGIENTRAFLEAGLLLARTTRMGTYAPEAGATGATGTVDALTASGWLLAVVTEDGTLPPPGFVVDLGTLLLSGAIDSKAFSPPHESLAEAASAYEHQCLARIAGDPLLLPASDALARLPKHLIPAAIGLLTSMLLRRIGFEGVAMPAGALRALGQTAVRREGEVPEDPYATLREDSPALDALQAGYKSLVSCARQARSLLSESDIFVLDHLDVLESLAQRVALGQVLEAEEVLTEGLPKRLPKKRAAGAVQTALEDEDTYPVGGFSSITTSGSLENLVISELIYMSEDPEEDLFDLRYAEGELLYYTRDESTMVRRRRSIDFVFDPDIEKARVRSGDLEWQRSVAALALVHATIARMAKWLGDEELRVRVLFPVCLKEERVLAELLLREEIERGIVSVIGSDVAAEASETTRESSFKSLEAMRLRGLVQQVTVGGEARALSKRVECFHLDVATGGTGDFQDRLAGLLRKLP